MSPIYESERDRKAQQYAAKVLESHGWKVQTHPTKHTWDLTITKPRRPPILVEVKARDIDWGEYPDIFIDKPKADAIVAGGVGWLVIVPRDNLCRLTWLIPARLESYALDRRDVRPERDDPNDKGDIKYLVPLINFHPLYLLN